MSRTLARQRQCEIAERLQAEGRVIAVDLAALYAVSEDTIRRDLREMAAAGTCVKVYGGALPVAPTAGPIAERESHRVLEKAALAEATAALIAEGTSLFIDAGSTNIALARELASRNDLTIATNSPAVAMAIRERSGPSVVLVGGRFDPHTGACLGAKAVADAEQFRCELMVLGACGADPSEGITAFSQEEAEFKRRIAETSRTIVALATSDKLGTVAPFAVLAASRLDRLVTEADADASLLSRFQAAGVAITRVLDR